MEIETLQGTEIENGTVRSVRIKERKNEDWESEEKEELKEDIAWCSNSNSDLAHDVRTGNAMFHPYFVVTVSELRPTDPQGIYSLFVYVW